MSELGGPLRVAPSASAQLRGDDAPGHPRHPQSGVMARPRRCADPRDLPAVGSVREAGGRGGGSATRLTSGTVQGTRRADRISPRPWNPIPSHGGTIVATAHARALLAPGDYAEHR